MVAALFDIRQTYELTRLEWYINSVFSASLIMLPVTYAGMLFLGVPVHIALVSRNEVHRFNYVAFGLAGGVFAGILFGSIAFPVGPVLITFCGLVVSYAFCYLVQERASSANAAK